jgi:hypothetical protein
MNGLPFLLSSIALATLAGCAESGITLASDPGLLAQAQAGAGGTVAAASPAASALRAGVGRVESILVVPTAGAAGSKASKTISKQITMRMDDGTLQYFDTQGNVMVGDRIEVTSNGTMRRGLGL